MDHEKNTGQRPDIPLQFAVRVKKDYGRHDVGKVKSELPVDIFSQPTRAGCVRFPVVQEGSGANTFNKRDEKNKEKLNNKVHVEVRIAFERKNHTIQPHEK